MKTIEPNINFLNQIRIPKLADIELIAVSITAEYLSIDSEYQLFRKLPKILANKIERSVYNRRRRKLFPFIEQIRQKMAGLLIPYEDYFIVDSMPLEICKLSRIHAVCSLNGVFQSFDLTKASVQDIHFLKNLKNEFSQCTIIGDKGYLNAEYQLYMFESNRITLEVSMRKNQVDFKPQAFIFRKSRKRIETLLSQLCDQFMIRRNYAKSFDGFKNRLLTKITSLTVIQLINRHNGKNANNLKIAIA